jgi:hypothetical protein
MPCGKWRGDLERSQGRFGLACLGCWICRSGGQWDIMKTWERTEQHRCSSSGLNGYGSSGIMFRLMISDPIPAFSSIVSAAALYEERLG